MKNSLKTINVMLKISDKNRHKIEKLYLFCMLYKAHRDFDLSKRVAKNKPLNWKQAESLANFCNQIVVTKHTTPQEFLSDDNTNADKAIDKFLELKTCIKLVKNKLGANGKNELYKSVKAFYREKAYCYQMDSFYTNLIWGAFIYAKDLIPYDVFLKIFCFEVSLFTGEKKPINLRQVIKMSNYILSK